MDLGQSIEQSTGRQFNFEEELARLETLVGLLEREGLPLDKAVETYAQCAALSKKLTQALDAAEQRVRVLLADDTEAPFEV